LHVDAEDFDAIFAIKYPVHYLFDSDIRDVGCKSCQAFGKVLSASVRVHLAEMTSNSDL